MRCSFCDPEIHQGNCGREGAGCASPQSQQQPRPRWVLLSWRGPGGRERADWDRLRGPRRPMAGPRGSPHDVWHDWIACAVAPPYGGRVSTPGGASAPAGDATRMARERDGAGAGSRARGEERGGALGMRKLPRHEFMPENVGPSPMPIGRCLSAWAKPSATPTSSALMTELAAVGRSSRVLEIGTGSGYSRSARRACADVYSDRILAPLRTARSTSWRARVRAGEDSRG